MSEPTVSYEQAEALGVSREAFDEVLAVVGHMPTIDELSTLLAMWQQSGGGMSLHRWLGGKEHAVKFDDYLYSGSADHLSYREPRVKECLDVARQLAGDIPIFLSPSPLETGLLLYMVGDVGTDFADSEYARRCLHLVSDPMAKGENEEEREYIELILGAMRQSGLLCAYLMVGRGGLLFSLLSLTAPRGYDILAPREVRLDSFLFGEEPGRYLVALSEQSDDLFLAKLTEARLNCCFLGRTTKNRVMVDGFDFGLVDGYVAG